MQKISLFLLFFLSLNLFAYPQVSTAVKEKRLYPMGKKVYKKLCKSIEPTKYKSYEQMQEIIQKDKLCKKMKSEYFEALSLYLWDQKRVAVKQTKLEKIVVSKKDKCPICGMYVYKYPKWATQIFYKNKHYSFDGVKDMMKFYFTHEDGIVKILVRDYYTQKVINAKDAFYVLGSDVYGPMGNELIAFSSEKSARVFNLDHRGKEILRFNDIKVELLRDL